MSLKYNYYSKGDYKNKMEIHQMENLSLKIEQTATVLLT